MEKLILAKYLEKKSLDKKVNLLHKEINTLIPENKNLTFCNRKYYIAKYGSLTFVSEKITKKQKEIKKCFAHIGNGKEVKIYKVTLKRKDSFCKIVTIYSDDNFIEITDNTIRFAIVNYSKKLENILNAVIPQHTFIKGRVLTIYNFDGTKKAEHYFKNFVHYSLY